MKIIEGRATRSEFSKVFFFVIIAGLIISTLTLIDAIPDNLLVVAYIAFAILGNYYLISTGIKRLHDFNKSGWWYLVMPVPIANLVLLGSLLFTLGTIGENRFGTDNKYNKSFKPTPKSGAV